MCVCAHMDTRTHTHTHTPCTLICPIREIKAPQAVSNQTENEGTPTKYTDKERASEATERKGKHGVKRYKQEQRRERERQ